MLNIHKTSIILSFTSLWLTSYLTIAAQTFVGLALIFSFGILHGANDLELINRLDEQKTTRFIKILIAYIVLVLISVLLFMQIPVFALFIFIVVSAYHFGEQNWHQFLLSAQWQVGNAFEFIYGLIILFGLFYFNAIEVQQIIYKIAFITISKEQFLYVLIGSILLYTVLCYFLVKNNKTLLPKIIEQSLYLIILGVIFKTASLILGFAVYFIFWHSIPSLYDQVKFLYGTYNFDNFKKYFKTAFIYWIVSLFGVAALYFIAKDQIIFDALFFSFLASITFPHFIVMLKMYKK